jgi:hypothetical protein
MTIKRLNDSWPIKYEVNKTVEHELFQIFKWIESQEVPQGNPLSGADKPKVPWYKKIFERK